MTGRDLVVYILKNGLEDKPVFENGKFIGFMAVNEAAEKMNVGVATVHAWFHQGQVPGVLVRDGIYIPANITSPIGERSIER